MKSPFSQRLSWVGSNKAYCSLLTSKRPSQNGFSIVTTVAGPSSDRPFSCPITNWPAGIRTNSRRRPRGRGIESAADSGSADVESPDQDAKVVPAFGAGLPTSPKRPTAGLPDSGDLAVGTGARSGAPRTTGAPPPASSSAPSSGGSSIPVYRFRSSARRWACRRTKSPISLPRISFQLPWKGAFRSIQVISRSQAWASN